MSHPKAFRIVTPFTTKPKDESELDQRLLNRVRDWPGQNMRFMMKPFLKYYSYHYLKKRIAALARSGKIEIKLREKKGINRPQSAQSNIKAIFLRS